MSLLEDLVAADLKLRLVVGPAVTTFGVVLTAAVVLFRSEAGVAAGVVLGAIAAVAVGYAIARRVL